MKETNPLTCVVPNVQFLPAMNPLQSLIYFLHQKQQLSGVAVDCSKLTPALYPKAAKLQGHLIKQVDIKLNLRISALALEWQVQHKEQKTIFDEGQSTSSSESKETTLEVLLRTCLTNMNRFSGH